MAKAWVESRKGAVPAGPFPFPAHQTERTIEAALDAGLAVGETVELGGQLRAVEDIEVALCLGRLHAADAAEIPGGRHELVEQNLLQGALRSDVGLELGEEFVEFFAILSSDDELGGGESVFAGIL
jgi:hypothetical protein